MSHIGTTAGLNLGLSALGLLAQQDASRKAASIAASGQTMQNQALQRQMALFDEMNKLYQARLSQGAYDPSSKIDLFRKAYQQTSGIAAGNMAAAASAMGYRPGDTEPGLQLAGQQSNLALKQAAGEQGIRDAALGQQWDDLRGIGGMAPSLTGQSVQAGQFQQGLGLQQQQAVGQGIGGLFALLAQSLSGMNKQPTATSIGTGVGSGIGSGFRINK